MPSVGVKTSLVIGLIMIKQLKGTYEDCGGQSWDAVIDCLTGEIFATPGTVPEIPGLDFETFFTVLGSMTIAIDIERDESNKLFACGPNFDRVQEYCDTLTRYYLFEIHEKVSRLEFTTYVSHVILPGEDVQTKADSCLLNWYGDDNGKKTEDYGEYNVSFNNYSVGYITYKEVNKEDWDVLYKYIR